MDSTPVTVNVSSMQLLLGLIVQFWLLVFPIILIRKVNYLTKMLQEHLYPEQEQSM